MLIYFFNLKKLSEPLNIYSKLEEMLTLRKLGWSYMALADRFNVPKTTIRYLCRKFGLHEKTTIVTVMRQDIRTTNKQPILLHNEREEIINPGKSYAEYLQDERERKWKKLTRNHLKY